MLLGAALLSAGCGTRTPRAPQRPAVATEASVRLGALTAYHPFSDALSNTEVEAAAQTESLARARERIAEERPAGEPLRMGSVSPRGSGREQHVADWQQQHEAATERALRPDSGHAGEQLGRARKRLLSQEEIRLREARAAESRRNAEATAEAFRRRQEQLGSLTIGETWRPEGLEPEEAERELDTELAEKQAESDARLAELEVIVQRRVDLDLARLERESHEEERERAEALASDVAEVGRQQTERLARSRTGPAEAERALPGASEAGARGREIVGAGRSSRERREAHQEALTAELDAQRERLQKAITAETKALVTRLALARNIVVYFEPHESVADRTEHFAELVRAHWAGERPEGFRAGKR